MLKFIAQIFIIWFVVYTANANSGERDPDVPAINEDLPLIMITGNGDRLALPTHVEIIKKWYRRQKKIRFSSYFYEKQTFYCPAETDKQKNKIKTANEILDREVNHKLDNCLFKKKKSKKMTSGFPKCDKKPEPTMMKELRKKKTTETEVNNEDTQITELIPCGPKNEGQKLIFGYELCDEYGTFYKLEYRFSDKKKTFPFRVRSFSIYDICYNDAKKEILHTSHEIIAPYLLDHYLLEDERLKYPGSDIATHKLEPMSNIDFNEVKTEFEKIEEDDKFKIQMLVPLEDFPFLLWKKPVNHFVNVSLIHKELQECWNSIHDMIRNYTIQSGRHLKILTKAFRYVDSSSGKTWNKEENSKRIPSLWVKLVYHDKFYTRETKAVAIIANNYLDDNVREIISKKFKCDSNFCWRVTRYSDKCSKINRDIRCCKVSDEIKQLFGVTEIFKDVLDIAGLIEEPSHSQTASPFYRTKTSPSHV